MNFSYLKKDNQKQINEMTNIPRNERSYQSDFVCNIILNEMISKSQVILSRKEYILKMINEAKCKQGQNFAKNSCNSVLQNYLAEHEYLSPKMINEKSPCSPIKSPHSFLNYEQLVSQTQRDETLTVKRQPWQKRRDSGKIYNCNKIFVVKKTKQQKETLEQCPSFKNISLNRNASQFSGRYSHKTDIKKISANHNIFVPRLSNSGRLTVNHFPASTRNSPKNSFFRRGSTQRNRSSILQQKQNIKNHIDHNNLVKLQLNKRNSEEKSFKTIQNQKQLNNYISCLRDRKEKLENIMKDFDDDQIKKKKEKNQREVLMRQSKTENLAETFSKVPTMTTDYNGNIMRVREPKLLGQINQIINNVCQTRLPKYQSNNQGVLNNSVSFKIKDIDDKTKNFLNQIFSSARATPSKTGRKIAFNETQLTKKYEEKHLSSNVSFTNEGKNNRRSKAIFQPSIKAFELSKPKILINGNEKKIKSMLKFDAKSLNQNLESDSKQLNKENDQEIQISKQLVKTNKGIKSKGNLITQISQREVKKVQPSLLDLQKIYRQEYIMKKQRIHPNILKNNKQQKFILGSNQTIKQVTNQNTEKNIEPKQNSQKKNLFQAILSRAF